nr:hypothetical protein RVX_0105 [Nitratidesulfovibrio sp. HK-II]
MRGLRCRGWRRPPPVALAGASATVLKVARQAARGASGPVHAVWPRRKHRPNSGGSLR